MPEKIDADQNDEQDDKTDNDGDGNDYYCYYLLLLICNCPPTISSSNLGPAHVPASRKNQNPVENLNKEPKKYVN